MDEYNHENWNYDGTDISINVWKREGKEEINCVISLDSGDNLGVGVIIYAGHTIRKSYDIIWCIVILIFKQILTCITNLRNQDEIFLLGEKASPIFKFTQLFTTEQ